MSLNQRFLVKKTYETLVVDSFYDRNCCKWLNIYKTDALLSFISVFPKRTHVFVLHSMPKMQKKVGLSRSLRRGCFEAGRSRVCAVKIEKIVIEWEVKINPVPGKL